MLSVRDLRVDSDVVPALPALPAVDGLTFKASARRTLVMGAPRELMLACAGMLPIVRGEILFDDQLPSRALAAGRLAASPLDAPMPPSFTPLRYVEWSARLAGISRSAAPALAAANLERVGVTGSLAKGALRRQTPYVRRATQLAATLVPTGATLVLWDPLENLDPESAARLGQFLASILEGASAVVFASRVPLGGPLAAAAEEVVYVERSRVVAQGSLREVATRGRRFRVLALGDRARFIAALSARGIRIDASATPDGPVDASEDAELAIELGSVENVEIFRAAADAGAVVVEMRPSAALFC
jgi:ABC-type multidrug transport system ATPase subunit